MKKLTIAIPNYNKENFLVTTLDSVISQTDKDFELIIIDNQSTDKSWKIISEYKKKNPWIKISRNKKNIGMSGNWNLCAKKATGEYVFIMFSDDIISPNFVKLTKKIISEYKVDAINYAYSLNSVSALKKNSEIIKKHINYAKKNTVFSKYLKEELNLTLWSFVAKRKMFIENPYSNKYGFAADTEFLRKVFHTEKYSLVHYNEQMLCKTAYGYLTGLSLNNESKYKLYLKESIMLNKELKKLYYTEKIKDSINYAYYSQILRMIGAIVYYGDFKKAKIMMKQNEKLILKYTNKTNIIRYYKLMIFFKVKELIPQKLKNFLYCTPALGKLIRK